MFTAAAHKPVTPQQIFGLVKDELQEVEREFARQSESSVRTISDIGKYLQESGGKRIRPCLLAAMHKIVRPRGSGSDQACSGGRIHPRSHAGSRRHYRWSGNPARPPGRQSKMGQSSYGAGRRLAVHAVVRCGPSAAEFSDSRHSHRSHPEDGGRRADPIDVQWKSPYQRNRCFGHCPAQNRLLVFRMCKDRRCLRKCQFRTASGPCAVRLVGRSGLSDSGRYSGLQCSTPRSWANLWSAI